MENIRLQNNTKYDFRDLIENLISFGYEKTEGDLISGDFGVSGGTIRVFPVNELNIFTLDFFGDELETINSVDPKTMLRSKYTETLQIDKNIFKLEDNSVLQRESLVVHEDYGIGQFMNVQTLQIFTNERIKYINLKYLNDEILRVPENQIEKLSRYIGVGRRMPKLSRLGSSSWKNTYQKTYENALLLARELLSVYAKRHLSKKTPRKFSREWEDLVKRTFEFTETDDQAKAIDDIYQDLQSEIPSDRLICGDVGFGKTEIALRAAAQTIANGYQVAMLVPTTILAEQHYTNFCKRYAGTPAKIEHLSRFVETGVADKIVKAIESGSVDIVIGTHALLRKTINFKNLGLLIIDEEQKFGVKDKEMLKNYRENIDVLTLTATPIPRTMYMAISGIRGISQISSIPTGRKSVDTNITKYDENLVREYIKREADRGGQVYFLHNRVQSINGTKRRLAQLFPDLRIRVAHGQMKEGELARIMTEFTAEEVDILVCSTIIESGIDLPNANTLIVEDADKFGLSQLYQIRGRIGRSPKQAYALFTYQNKKITGNALKRLEALGENTELGTGYEIALSDLEIRGGGNILGKEQHGSMEAVGLMLYSKLLKLAVDRLRSQNLIELD